MGLAQRWQEAKSAAHQFFRRHWQRALIIRDWLRLSEEAFHLLLAACIGIGGGLITILYHVFNQLIQLALLQQYGDILTIGNRMEQWQRILVPTVGGLAAGLVLFLGLRLIRTPGLTNLLEVVVAGDGRLPLRNAVVSAISSLISISTGASIGREGLIIQLSATAASKLGQWAKWPPYRLRLLVACGAAAGLAGGCNAPITGAVFAAQIVLGNFSMNLFAPLVVAAVTSTIVSRSFFGSRQWYEVPAFDFTSLTQLPWFVLLGVLSGILGAVFLKSLRWAEAQVNELKLPLYLRLA